MKVLLTVVLFFGSVQEDVSRNVLDLLQRLRSDEASERDEAAKKLRGIGKAAIPELEKASKEGDVDLAARARDILKRIDEDAHPRPKPADLHPDKATLHAPATFKAEFRTSKGKFVVQVTREWAPLGADRFYNLVKMGYYDDCRFFRVISGFMC
jgi:hypothetical protein